MFTQKNFTFRGVMAFTGFHIIWMTVWAWLVAFIYEYKQGHYEWMNIPWLPLSVIGTAVAFYIGFKNNQAYDRLWEARKIWGAIVNDSRSWGSMIRAFTSNYFKNDPVGQQALEKWHKRLIYSHIGWLYTLRSQLLIPTPWEHINQGRHVARATRSRMKRFGVGLLDCDNAEHLLMKYLPKEKYQTLINYRNTATQILDMQAQDLQKLREQELIEDFRHMELQKLLQNFYTHQGKCERIKKFPLPRQYGGVGLIFVSIFIFLLPFGMVYEFHKLGDYGAWLSIPFTVVISWIYLTMELVGDYSENPFEGLGNDIPMLSLCRVIETDLLEMLGEKDIPPPIESKNGVLM